MRDLLRDIGRGADRRNARELGFEGFHPRGIDRLFVHAAQIEVGHLALRGIRGPILPPQGLHQVADEGLVLLLQHGVNAPVGTVPRDGVGLEPAAVGKPEEVGARLDRAVHPAEIESVRIGRCCAGVGRRTPRIGCRGGAIRPKRRADERRGRAKDQGRRFERRPSRLYGDAALLRPRRRCAWTGGHDPGGRLRAL